MLLGFTDWNAISWVRCLERYFDLLFSVFCRLWLSWIFFSDVVDFFLEGEEEELTKVFHRLWLPLIFIRREKRKKGGLLYLLWKSSV